MGELTFNLLQFGYLALLWLFVLSAVLVLRRDISTRTDGSTKPPRKSRKLKGDAKPVAASGAAKAARAKTPTRLSVVAGGLKGTSLPLTGAAIMIGRQPGCTLVLDDDYASSRHARIFPQEGQWYLEDLNSTNGTFVANTQIQGTVPLSLGTPVQIGRTVLELQA